MQNFSRTALKMTQSGISVIPLGPDKVPMGPWKEFQERIASKDYVEEHFENCEIGLVCGRVSGNIEVIDVDTKNDINGDLLHNYKDLIDNTYIGLWDRLVIQTTISGGIHLIYKAEKISGNLKLASRPPTKIETEINPRLKAVTLIETRGEGGYIVAAPSNGYNIIQGSLSNIPFINTTERELIHAAARALNGVIEPFSGDSTLKPPSGSNDLRPFDDFNNRCTPDRLMGILLDHGWSYVFSRGAVKYVRRPGKNKGVSASVGYCDNRLYVFSTSTEFEAPRSYSPSAVLAILQFNGDFNAAASHLYKHGYGDRVTAKVEIKGVNIIKAENIRKEIADVFRDGLHPGYNTGFFNLNPYYRIVPGHVTVGTGTPQSGKTTFMNNIMINMSQMYNWKHLVFSPESFPISTHILNLSEIYTGKPAHGPNKMADKDLDSALEFIDEYFTFLDTGEESVSLEGLLSTASTVYNKAPFQMMIIDPISELFGSRGNKDKNDFLLDILISIRKFSRVKNVSTQLLAHPRKLKQDDEGGYEVPGAYDIAHSAEFFNKADSIWVLRRMKFFTEVHVQKIKLRHTGSLTLEPPKLRFEKESGRFTDYKEDAKISNWWDNDTNTEF